MTSPSGSRQRSNPHTLHVVQAFGALSGLQVHPANSQLIFLNRSVKLEEYAGIAVVSIGDTTRHLGYEIGTGEFSEQELGPADPKH